MIQGVEVEIIGIGCIFRLCRVKSAPLIFFRCRKEIPYPLQNDEYSVREAAGTMDPLTPNLPSGVSPVLPLGRDLPRDGRLLSPCRWGIRSRVLALLRLARPLGTFGRQGM